MNLPTGEANRERDAPPPGTDPTDPNALLTLSNQLWDVNQAAIQAVAQKACEVCEIPPELLQSPAAARFLAKVQRLTFLVGVAATLTYLDQIEKTVPANAGSQPASAEVTKK